MKKCIALSVSIVLAVMVCSGAWGDVPIDEEHFPDSVFREKISEKDTDGDGVLSDEEIAEITSLSLLNAGISSLKGVEYLTAIKILWCDSNHLTALDVRKIPLWRICIASLSEFLTCPSFTLL